MYDKKYWRQGKNVTVGQFMDYIRKNVPEDAVFCVLGNNQIYFHLEEDKNRLVCAAASASTQGNALCKSFSTKTVPCAASNYNCYAL